MILNVSVEEITEHSKKGEKLYQPSRIIREPTSIKFYKPR